MALILLIIILIFRIMDSYFPSWLDFFLELDH